jgi:hypothetical protein
MPVVRSSAWPLALAILIRLSIWFVLPGSRFASDEDSYYNAGMTLVESGEQDLFWPPVTGWLIAAAAAILQTTEIRWLRVVWIAFDIGCLLAVRTLARRVAPAIAGSDIKRAERFTTLVTLGYAIYLPAIAFAQFMTSETPALLQTLLVLVLITNPNATWRSFAVAGVLAGTLVLTRPSVLPLLVFLPAANILKNRGPKATPQGPRYVRDTDQALRNSLVFLLTGFTVVGAVIARNWWTIDEATIARNSAYNLYIGNRDLYAEDLDLFHPVATPAQIEFRRQYFGGELTYPAGSPAELQREALAWIAAHPATFARRALGRLARVFAPKTDVLELAGGEPRAGIFSARSIALLGIANVQWIVVLFGGIVGLALLWHMLPGLGVPLVFAVLGSLPLCLIAISKPRYAFGFEPVLLLGAAVFFSAPRGTVNRLRRADRITLALIVAFLIWAWVAWLVFAFSSRLALTA